MMKDAVSDKNIKLIMCDLYTPIHQAISLKYLRHNFFGSFFILRFV